MARWAKEEVRKIADADDLHIAPFRDDGTRTRAATVKIMPRDTNG